MTTSKRDIAKEATEARELLDEVAGGPLTIGNTLEATRLGEEMSQVAFAKLLGISKQELCDIEKGRKPVSIKRAAEFARKLGYSESQYVRLAIQDQLRRADMNYEVSLRGVNNDVSGEEFFLTRTSAATKEHIKKTAGKKAVIVSRA
jgi:transcriptional regulator with XRE-family HTH domain